MHGFVTRLRMVAVVRMEGTMGVLDVLKRRQAKPAGVDEPGRPGADRRPRSSGEDTLEIAVVRDDVTEPNSSQELR